MESKNTTLSVSSQRISLLSGGIIFVLVLLLAFSALGFLVTVWREDPGLSHGPILFLITGGLLWMKRSQLRTWESANPQGLVLLVLASLLLVGSVVADIAFLQPLSFFTILLSGILFLGGREAFLLCLGPIGLLGFSIPWPTTLVSAISFPLQLFSSAYAALFAGMLGMPIHRNGVEIFVTSESGDKVIYSIIVAQKCSGLTSLMVLLAFTYLIAYFTPVRWWGRLLMMSAVAPLALFGNAVRLTIILLVGGHYGAKPAQWVHDNEQPILIFLCSFGLLGLRALLMRWIPLGDSTAGIVTPELDETPDKTSEAEV
ncbi:exosortase/archaeosortase family protein [Armatimonas rosea]|nr:exosortase/archaeosortase family protein [Armatimonas rosea]